MSVALAGERLSPSPYPSSSLSSSPHPSPSFSSSSCSSVKMSVQKDGGDYEELPSFASPQIHMFAGAMAGIAEHTITFPFDSIKTRMQVLRPHPSAVYSGVVHAFQEIISREGVTRLYRGIMSIVAGAGPAHAIYFASYEQAKKILVVGEASHSPTLVGLSGALATVASDAFMTPFDVIKQRMQVHGSVYRSMFDCARSIIQKESFGAFFVSYPVTLILNVPFHMVQFPVYEFSRSVLNSNGGYSPLTHIFSGGISGGLAALLTTPVDVIKTTLQTRDLAGTRIKGIRQAISMIIKEYGPAGFLRGAVPRMLSHVPATAVCWSVYEYFKWVLVK